MRTQLGLIRVPRLLRVGSFGRFESTLAKAPDVSLCGTDLQVILRVCEQHQALASQLHTWKTSRLRTLSGCLSICLSASESLSRSSFLAHSSPHHHHRNHCHRHRRHRHRHRHRHQHHRHRHDRRHHRRRHRHRHRHRHHHHHHHNHNGNHKKKNNNNNKKKNNNNYFNNY